MVCRCPHCGRAADCYSWMTAFFDISSLVHPVSFAVPKNETDVERYS